ncbi:MAG: sigma-70 family RNA polymerase sigma factor [Oscillospiraceae bacterium]|nr:sigma-70 family RNA polymerase sigma factor [Oscillospiraceae bacterium]
MDNGASSYRRYLNGDESAFHDIVKEYFDSLVFFVDRYVRDPAAAEDIAIDAFTQLVVHKHRYNFQVSLKTYLFMIGRSRALDYIRHRNKFPTVKLSEAGTMASDEPSLEELILADERKRAVNAALAQLGDDMRVAVHLVYFEELTCEEAARVMRKSRKQVYNLLYRAKNALRTILGQEGELLL